jgi:prepilin signal peptidase PulO-like enzyme (type II secretory pathway)
MVLKISNEGVIWVCISTLVKYDSRHLSAIFILGARCSSLTKSKPYMHTVVSCLFELIFLVTIVLMFDVIETIGTLALGGKGREGNIYTGHH